MYKFRLRRGLSTEWASKNPVLQDGEPGLETDTRHLKVGDGRSAWNQLASHYITAAEIAELIADAIEDSPGGGVSQEDLSNHVNSETPHPVYDDGPSFILIYLNAKV